MKKVVTICLLLLSIEVFSQTYPNINPGGGAVLFKLRIADNPIEVPVEREVTQMYYTDGLFIYTTDRNTPWACKWTIIDLEGNQLVSNVAPFWNSQAGVKPAFYNKRAITSDGYIIDPSFRVIAKPPKGLFGISPSFVDGVASACLEIRDQYDIQRGFKIVYINTDCDIIYPHLSCEVDDPILFPVRSICDGLRAYYDAKLNQWGYIDAEGRIAIKPQFIEAHDFREGLAAIMTQEGKWGFIDTSGNMKIEPRFSIEPGDFYCGVAVVTRQNEKSTLLYKDGSIFDGDFGRITPAIKDYCLAEQYRGGDLLLIHRDKGVLGKLPGTRYDLAIETDYRVPFFLFHSGIYSHEMIPILKMSHYEYLEEGWFWRNSYLDYGAVIFDVTGECKIVFPIKRNDSF